MTEVRASQASSPAKTTTMESDQIRNQILSALLAAGAEYVSGERLSETAGVSRTAIWKHIKALEALGFEVQAAHKLGYRLIHVPDLLLQPLLCPRLRENAAFGRVVHFAAERDSTNRTAMTLAAEGAPHGTLVSAWEQTGGRGRRGRVWFSPRGGLWMSLVLQQPIALARAAELTLLTSVAVRRAIVQTCDITPDIKWPNDLLLGGRKICGILAEIRADGESVQHAVIGVGINSDIRKDAFPDTLLDVATSLSIETGHAVSNLDLAAAILTELEPMVNDLAAGGPGFAAVAGEWRAASATLGRRVTVQNLGERLEGEAVDVDESGVLYLRLDNEDVVQIHSGDVLF